MRVIGEFLAELGRGLVERPPAVERVVPAPEVDILDEAKPRLVLGNLPGEEAFGVPAVEDVADSKMTAVAFDRLFGRSPSS